MTALFWSAAVVISIVFFFITAKFIRIILSKNIDEGSKSRRLLKFIKPITLGGLTSVSWVIWSMVALTGALFFWQAGLAIFVLAVCVIISKRFRKKDTIAEVLQAQKAQLSDQIKQLSKSYEILEKESVENITHVVGVADHRAIILSALKDAQSRIIILSGWLTDWAFNNEFRSLVMGALQRGVVIYIGYGYKAKNETFTRKEQKKAEQDLYNLQAWCAEKDPKGQLIKMKYPNHAKLLIVDNNYAVCGSFNWLSNREGQNAEMSFKVANTKKVDELADEIIDKFESAPPDRRGFIKSFLPFSRH